MQLNMLTESEKKDIRLYIETTLHFINEVSELRDGCWWINLVKLGDHLDKANLVIPYNASKGNMPRTVIGALRTRFNKVFTEGVEYKEEKLTGVRTKQVFILPHVWSFLVKFGVKSNMSSLNRDIVSSLISKVYDDIKAGNIALPIVDFDTSFYVKKYFHPLNIDSVEEPTEPIDTPIVESMVQEGPKPMEGAPGDILRQLATVNKQLGERLKVTIDNFLSASPNSKELEELKSRCTQLRLENNNLKFKCEDLEKRCGELYTHSISSSLLEIRLSTIQNTSIPVSTFLDIFFRHYNIPELLEADGLEGVEDVVRKKFNIWCMFKPEPFAQKPSFSEFVGKDIPELIEDLKQNKYSKLEQLAACKISSSIKGLTAEGGKYLRRVIANAPTSHRSQVDLFAVCKGKIHDLAKMFQIAIVQGEVESCLDQYKYLQNVQQAAVAAITN